MGAEPLALHWQNYNNSKIDEEVTAPSKKGAFQSLVERVWKKIPVPLTFIFGPRSRKYISL